ncbi:hypothetical protein SAMN05444349_10791 [Bacteroides faecichinchillae]|uniref:Uncharacterized protein n=1 Tax=Bacteroides faecichinchillae TaxID=871325 RepID=A0A1M4WZ76_9BACE|nr:hypothetical protein SAMN05444349_10791 [Bacteroides faecichinchillae]
MGISNFTILVVLYMSMIKIYFHLYTMIYAT